jgi:hypothetical protein
VSASSNTSSNSLQSSVSLADVSVSTRSAAAYACFSGWHVDCGLAACLSVKLKYLTPIEFKRRYHAPASNQMGAISQE